MDHLYFNYGDTLNGDQTHRWVIGIGIGGLVEGGTDYKQTLVSGDVTNECHRTSLSIPRDFDVYLPYLF
jgi:hypothetical protein